MLDLILLNNFPIRAFSITYMTAINSVTISTIYANRRYKVDAGRNRMATQPQCNIFYLINLYYQNLYHQTRVVTELVII